MEDQIYDLMNSISVFTDRLPKEICDSIRSSTGSMTLRTAKMLLNAVGASNLIETDQKKYDKLLSFAFGSLAEKAYDRHPNFREKQNLDYSLIEIKDIDFRELDCNFLYIRCPILLKQLNISNQNDDGVVAFGYIDYEAGLSFDVIASAHIENNQVIINEIDGTCRTKIRHGFFLNIPSVKVLNLMETNADLGIFYSEVGMHELYYRDITEDLDSMRMNRELDASRHPSFPDDIQIHLVKDGRIVEAPWARCDYVDKTKGFMYAKLLNEPHNEFDFHMNDSIPFRTMQNADGSLICVNMEHYNN